MASEQPEAVKLHPTPVATAPVPPRAPPPPPATSKDEDAPGHYIATLFESRYFIAAATVLTVAIALGYIAVATPTWESESVVQIEEQSKTLAGLQDLSSILGERDQADAEIELIKSRTLLGSVVDQLNLTVDARPVFFPLFGAAYARYHDDGAPVPPPYDLRSYAWGGEHLTVSRLDLADAHIGSWLELVALDKGAYELRDQDGRKLVTGQVGKLARAADGSTIHVRELVARPGTRFHVRQRSRDTVVDELRQNVHVNERGKKTGIISISLQGKDRLQVPAILDAIAQGYVLQNVQRKSAEAAKTLEFIEEQLPGLKQRVDASEAALNEFQRNKGTVDLSAETQAMLDRSVEIEKALSDLELQRSDLTGRFAGDHPMLVAIRQKADKLRAEKAAIAAKMKNVPAQELDSARLQRDVKVASELYFMLLNKAQELRVVKSGTLGNVRVIDPAIRPYQPVSPKPFFALALGLILGLTGGVALAFVRRAIHGGMDDPDAIEALTGLSIYAAIPHSRRQAQVGDRRSKRGVVLAELDPNEPSVEALRSLRTNLQFALLESGNNVIAITGPAPGVGKSFVACNFAHVLAAFGQRVLLIDGDLRRGVLHRDIGFDRAPGLSDLLASSASLGEAIHKTKNENLDLLPSGSHRPNPSEMLGSNRFPALLEQVSKMYDLVLLDTPPVLAVTDAALIGRCAGVNVLVLRAGEHNSREIKVAVKRLAHGGAPAQGIVLNDAMMGPSRYGRFGQYGYYRYEYTQK